MHVQAKRSASAPTVSTRVHTSTARLAAAEHPELLQEQILLVKAVQLFRQRLDLLAGRLAILEWPHIWNLAHIRHLPHSHTCSSHAL